jgi:Mlc titration factor MtfA (ptsG expression regulator)
VFTWWRKRRRQRVLEDPFRVAWQEALRRNVGYAEFLDEVAHQRLEDLVQVFLAEKSFEGCGGLTLTDEIRVTIAANACILLLGLDHDLYSDVETILVYPSTVRPPQRSQGLLSTSVAVVTNESPHLLGEAHMHGPVILVWDSVRRGSRHPRSGHNVVFHEFAHKLDMLDHSVDGTPPLNSRKQYARWSKACGAVYFSLKQKVEQGLPTFLDPYAAESEGEFFAVATEQFFEQPVALKDEHADLYEVLSEFYQQDPAARMAAKTSDAPLSA